MGHVPGLYQPMLCNWWALEYTYIDWQSSFCIKLNIFILSILYYPSNHSTIEADRYAFCIHMPFDVRYGGREGNIPLFNCIWRHFQHKTVCSWNILSCPGIEHSTYMYCPMPASSKWLTNQRVVCNPVRTVSFFLAVQVKLALTAIRQPWPANSGGGDIFDWLKLHFGFQVKF